MDKKKKKRRGSQMFKFEQNEETLLQNEAIINLYNNKNYAPPEQKALETIYEDFQNNRKTLRPKRGSSSSTGNDSFLLGKNLEKRFIEDYRFWKQDDKDRLKKRKSKISKQWKGRIKPRKSVDEVKINDCLKFLLDNLEVSEDESSESKETTEIVPYSAGSILNYLEKIEPCPKLIQEEKFCSKSTRESTNEDILVIKSRVSSRRSQALKESVQNSNYTPSRPENENFATNNINTSLSSFNRESKINEDQFIQFTKPTQTVDHTVVPDESLISLQNIIPAEELQEILESDDLLFCDIKAPGKENSRKSKRESCRRSIRRSARLQHSELQGSVFTEEIVEISVKGESKQISSVLSDRNNRTPLRCTDNIQHVKNRISQDNDDALSELLNCSLNLKNNKKPDEIDCVELSAYLKHTDQSGVEYEKSSDIFGNRSNNNVSSEREINISLPDSVRRSLTGEYLPRRLSPELNRSDEDEDEVIISGIFGKKTLNPKTNKKLVKKHHNVK